MYDYISPQLSSICVSANMSYSQGSFVVAYSAPMYFIDIYRCVFTDFSSDIHVVEKKSLRKYMFED